MLVEHGHGYFNWNLCPPRTQSCHTIRKSFELDSICRFQVFSCGTFYVIENHSALGRASEGERGKKKKIIPLAKMVTNWFGFDVRLMWHHITLTEEIESEAVNCVWVGLIWTPVGSNAISETSRFMWIVASVILFIGDGNAKRLWFFPKMKCPRSVATFFLVGFFLIFENVSNNLRYL